MAKYLAKNLIDLSSRSLSPNRTTELGLYHREGGFHIRPLVVMLQKGFPIEVVEMPHSVPQAVKLVMMVAPSSGIDFERNKRRSALSLNSPKVLSVGVGFVCRHLVDGEHLGSPADQSGELPIVRRLIGGRLYTGDNVGFDTANQVGLYPSLLTALSAIFVVKPSGICGGGEARRVNGEVGLYSPQRAGALLNESLEQGCQFGVLQIAEGAGERRGLSDQSLSFRFPQVGHEASAGHSRVDLISNPKHDISQWQPRATKPVFWLGYAVAEVSEQGDKAFLLMGLSLIIGSPLLGAGHFDRLRIDGAAIGLGLPLNYEFNCMNVLAGQVASLKVGAGAERLAVVEVDYIASVAGLGGDFPAQLVFLNLACVGYNQPSFFSCVHLNTPSLISLFYAYYTIQCIALSMVFIPI